MIKRLLFSSLIVVAIASALYANHLFERANDATESELTGITLPENFFISVFADDLSGGAFSISKANPRFMAYYGDVLLVSIMSQGRVIALPDKNKDGKADEAVTMIEGLRNPHGLAVHNGELYIASEDSVLKGSIGKRYKLENVQTIIDGIPSDGGHSTRTILIKNGSIYLSVGSTCNACEEKHSWRASVLKCTLRGECEIFASGLRNSVGMAFHPETGELWGTENGRDWLGNDLPPDEINVIKKGRDYGWPACYGNGIHDADYDPGKQASCEKTESPILEIQAHSAPLGMAFYDGKMFPKEYVGDLFVAYHGSWNRRPPTGYKIVRVKLKNSTVEVEDFATGWLNGTSVTGRPVDVAVAKDGALLVSDDKTGKIYRISHG